MTARRIILACIILACLHGYGNAQQYHALLINGFAPDETEREKSGLSRDAATPVKDNMFWNDTYLMWETLLARGFDNSRIHVLYHNGTNSQPDWWRYRVPPPAQLTDAPATYATVCSTLASLASTLTSEDVLFIWTFGHGDVHLAEGKATLELYNGEHIDDDDFADRVEQIQCAKRIIVMGQCHSGGFLDDFNDSNTFVLTAAGLLQMSSAADDSANDGISCIENEVHEGTKYYHGEFNYHVLSAMRGQPVAPGGEPVGADGNQSGAVSFSEIATWVVANETDDGAVPELGDPYTVGPNSYVSVVADLAGRNRSQSSYATGGNNQRKVIRDPLGNIHEVFESSGRIFYRKSADGGANWFITCQLSADTLTCTAPCLVVAGFDTLLLATWQRAVGSGYNIYYARSTNGGRQWTGRDSITAITCAAPGPIPSVAGYSSGHAMIVYRTSGGLKYRTSTNSGSSWGSILSVPGTGANTNLPSTALYSTFWSAKQANLAYATDLPTGSPQIQFNYYDYLNASWASATNLSSILPIKYAHHADPSLAVSASEASGNKAVHVVWDAEDTDYPGTRVLVHREGGFRTWPSSYSILQYQSENKASITGVSNDRAWLVCQSSSGSSVWKRSYDGSYWSGATWLGNGGNPQISVGSSSAKYIWTQGTQSPYQISVGSENLNKTDDAVVYSRALTVIDPARGSSVTVEFGEPRITLTDGSWRPVCFTSSVPEDTLLTQGRMLEAGETEDFTVPAEALAISVPISVSASAAEEIMMSTPGTLSLVLVDAGDGKTLGVTRSITFNAPEADRGIAATIEIPLQSLSGLSSGSAVRLRPVLEGVPDGGYLVRSIGHIYRSPEAGGLAKDGVYRISGEVPQQSTLYPNYPNPFNPRTRFEYDVAEPAEISLVIYDMVGREVAVLARGYHASGRYSVTWDAQDHAGTPLASGVYMARFSTLDGLGNLAHSAARKIVYLK